MASEWPVITFGELIQLGELEIGDGYRAKNSELTGDGLIFLRAGHVTDTHIDFNGTDRLCATAEPTFGAKISRPGDVIVTTKGNSTGRLAFVTSDMPRFVYSPHLSYWRAAPKGRLEQAFLRAWSRGTQFSEQLAALSRSTDMAPYLSLTDQRTLSVTIPPKPIQRCVGALNDSVDQRLELLRQTNTTLEAIAQALLKSWFVDFDPVRAKAEGREPDGMDVTTAALFPNSFEDSPLGPIPQGWGVGPLSTYSDLNALSWSNKNHPATLRYLDLSNVKDNRIDTVSDYPFADAPSRARRVLRSGDTIVGTVRPGNRSFAYVADADAVLTGSTGFAALSPKTTTTREFVYLAATCNSNIERLANLADGGAYPAVRPELVSATTTVLPPDPVLDAFSAIASSLFAKQNESSAMQRSLSELRDTLLPRLISGKLRLPEAETLIKEATP